MSTKRKSLLFSVWEETVAKIAAVDVAPPGEIPLAIETSSLVGYLWSAVRFGAPKSTAIMAFSTFISSSAGIALSIALGEITKQAFAGFDLFSRSFFLLLSLWAVIPIFKIIHWFSLMFSSQNIRVCVTDHLTARLMYSRAQNLLNKRIGDLVERIELAASCACGVVYYLTDTILQFSTFSLMACTMLLSIHSTLAILVGVWLTTSLILSGLLAYKGMEIVEIAGDKHANVIAKLTEIVTNIPLIRSFSTQKIERQKFIKPLESDLLSCRRVRSYWGFVLLLETVYKVLFGGTCVLYTVSLYGKGLLSVPQLVTVFSMMVSLVWQFDSLVFKFVDFFDTLGIFRASLRELNTVAIMLPIENKKICFPHSGKIKLSNTSKSYEGKKVLDNITLEIKSGEKVGIVGPSGSGKSTLLSIIRGDAIPDCGSVEIHGFSINEIPTMDLKRSIRESHQSAQVFNRSIRDNICYGVKEEESVSAERMDNVLRASQASVLVERLPQGTSTLIEEMGKNLSTGERQRISIARALISPSPILLFDEATASVDKRLESKILKHVIDFCSETTIIVVSHRVESLENFGVIFLLDHGRIVASGSHEKLSSESSLYRSLLSEDSVPACKN